MKTRVLSSVLWVVNPAGKRVQNRMYRRNEKVKIKRRRLNSIAKASRRRNRR